MAPDASARPFLQPWFERETLYSWASRFHVMQGRGADKRTGLTLFGRVNAPCQHDIPSGLNHFVSYTRGGLGDVASIAEQHTVLCEHRPFVSDDGWRSILLLLNSSEQSRNLRPKLGITAGGMGQRRSLRYCEQCANFEVDERGIATWHLVHQLLGSFVCPLHGRPLSVAMSNQNIWMLPLRNAVPARSLLLTDELLEAAFISSGIAKLCANLRGIDTSHLAQSAVQYMLKIGIAASIPRLNTAALSKWFMSTKARGAALEFHPNLRDLHSGEWIVRLLRGRRQCHPYHWQLLWTALLEELPQTKALDEFSGAVRGDLFAPSQLDLWPELADSLDFTIPAHQASVILDSWSIQEAAARLNFPKGTVKRWLRQDNAVSTMWREKRQRDRQITAVSRVKRVIQDQPQLTRSDLLKVCKTDMAWLDIHAKSVFIELLNLIPNARLHCNSSMQFPDF